MDDHMKEKIIIEEFKIKKRRQIILTVPMIIGMIVIVIMGENPEFAIPGIPVMYLMFGIIGFYIFAIIFSLKNWRCPACNKYLGKGMSPKFCQKCGVKLQ